MDYILIIPITEVLPNGCLFALNFEEKKRSAFDGNYWMKL